VTFLIYSRDPINFNPLFPHFLAYLGNKLGAENDSPDSFRNMKVGFFAIFTEK
jgi:hypothetical protein